MSHIATTKGVHPIAYEDELEMEEKEHELTGWVGWIGFAGFMMMLGGIFQAIAGMVGIFRDSFFVVGSNQLLIVDNIEAWGWINLTMGAIVFAAGTALFSGATWARVIAVTLAMLSAITHLLSITLYPIWSIIGIAICLVVIHAVVVHGRELKVE